jgi:hypothetical protein
VVLHERDHGVAQLTFGFADAAVLCFFHVGASVHFAQQLCSFVFISRQICLFMFISKHMVAILVIVSGRIV